MSRHSITHRLGSLTLCCQRRAFSANVRKLRDDSPAGSLVNLLDDFRPSSSPRTLNQPSQRQQPPTSRPQSSPRSSFPSTLDAPTPSSSSSSSSSAVSNNFYNSFSAISDLAKPRENKAAIDAHKVETNHRRQVLDKMSFRRWRVGDLYSPRDLSPGELRRWRGRQRPDVDVFDVVALKPMEHWKNYSMLSEYMTSMGRIRHSKDTGLTNVNQRRISRAIRRAVGMGFMPSVHAHPEMLRRIAARRRL